MKASPASPSSSKGTHRAIARAQAFARRHPHVLQVDVRQFFPSVDHQLLKAQIAKQVEDADGLELVGRILASGEGVQDEAYETTFFPGDDLLAAVRPRGLPIGNLTSQFWANVYLNAVDHFIKREVGCRGYVRYVDDLLLFGDDKGELWRWLGAIELRMASLRLRLHQGAHPRPVGEGFPFPGFTIFPERRRLKRRKGIHAQRRLVQLARDQGRRGCRSPEGLMAYTPATTRRPGRGRHPGRWRSCAGGPKGTCDACMHVVCDRAARWSRPSYRRGAERRQGPQHGTRRDESRRDASAQFQ